MSSSQIKQILIGCLFICLPVGVIVGVMLISQQVDGYLAELLTTLVGYFCTPMIMETFVFFLGFTTLLTYLAIKRSMIGDEFREMEVEVEEDE